MIFRLLARIKFSAPAGLVNFTMADAFSWTFIVRTFPHAVVIALILSKLIMAGKLEIMTRLLVPPAFVIFMTGFGTEGDPIVGMVLKLLLCFTCGGLTEANESTVQMIVRV